MSVVIVDGVRTPFGKFIGGLSDFSAADLGADVLNGVLLAAKTSPKDVRDVIMGNVLSAGLGQNPARISALKAGFPDTVNAFTVNMVCGSGLKSIMLAAQAIACGDRASVVAGGMESMSNAPHIINIRKAQKSGDLKLVDSMIHDGIWCTITDQHMGALAELLADRYHITREEQDRFALSSHKKAVSAIDSGFFAHEITPVAADKVLTSDEIPRRDTGMEKLRGLKPVFKEEGTITAGNASSLSDGAAAVLVMCSEKAKKLGLAPRAVILGYESSFTDPKFFGIAPVTAVRRLMEKLHLSLNDIDLIEINEAFAVQTLAVIKELGLDEKKVNINGGAVALGHPIGASGARLIVTLMNALEKENKRLGLAMLCIGGGGGVAMLIERL